MWDRRLFPAIRLLVEEAVPQDGGALLRGNDHLIAGHLDPLNLIRAGEGGDWSCARPADSPAPLCDGEAAKLLGAVSFRGILRSGIAETGS